MFSSQTCRSAAAAAADDDDDEDEDDNGTDRSSDGLI